MTIRELAGRLDRSQRTLRFKIIASIVAVLLAVGGYAATIVAIEADARQDGGSRTETVETDEAAETAGAAPLATDAASVARGAIERTAGQRPLRSLAAIVAAVGLSVVLVAVWLGLALTYVGLLLAGLVVAVPLALFGPTAGIGRLLVGLVPLLFMFLTLLQLARVAMGGSHPVTAVARNVLNEAVRMNISLVFIVVLLLLLAFIPNALTEDQPLRFRVQQWMQYGTGMGYGILALLTVFFASATVSFEQRDRIIWQTMSKPVAPWSYVLGKWLGVMALNVVLLSVISGGVFLFTQYLRFQPANGEVAYQVVNTAGLGLVDTRDNPRLRTEDRRILEDEVLLARSSVTPEPPEINEDAVRNLAERAIAGRAEREPDFVPTAAARQEAFENLLVLVEARTRAIPLGTAAEFTFTGLESARDRGGDLTLRYKINAGSNDPSAIYTLQFFVNGIPWPHDRFGNPDPQEVALKAAQRMSIPVVAELVTANGQRVPQPLVDDDGTLVLTIANLPTNIQEVSIPPDGLELLYPVGGYELNFLRVMTVMWVKLAFLAAVAIAASTFLSFPVACLLALGVLFAAESAGFLGTALQEYGARRPGAGPDPLRVLIQAIASPIAWMFQIYADLKPTEKLVDGRLLSWSSLLGATGVIGAWALAVLAAGVLVFRSRELALYSGK